MRYISILYGLLLISPSVTIAADAGDTPTDAKSISVKTKLKESLISPQDVDFFTFRVRGSSNPQIDNSGNISVTFSQKSPPGINPQSGWKVELFSENDLANSLYTAILPETSLNVKFEQGLSVGTYYYKVSSLDDVVYPAAEYTLTGIWKKNVHYERPPNDTPDNATSIRPNETYYGNLSSNVDVDYFRFNLETPDKVTIILNQDVPGIYSNGGWQFGLLSQADSAINMPSTSQTSVPLQVDLGAGVHYLFVKSMPTDDLAAIPVGRGYQIKVMAPSVAPPLAEDVCPFVFYYAKNPVTGHWATFPTICDVPNGWISQAEIPDSKVCPARNSSYKWPSVKDGVQIPGKVSIPYLDFTDLDGGEYLFRIELNQEGETTIAENLKFNIGNIKLVRIIKKPDVQDKVDELADKVPDNVDISIAK
ncbi:MAG TPA: hypothetical protein ENK59_09470 [Thioploca sp.]|nr:hypothetical protein [Thioploca sp.]